MRHLDESPRYTVEVRLQSQLNCLPTILAGVPREVLERRPAADKWSAKETLAHLARYHEVFRERVDRILREDRPVFTRYRAEKDSEWPPWAAKSPDAILGELRALRSRTIALFDGLSDLEVLRTGVHPRFGEMTLLQWTEFFLLHEAHHLYAVMQRARESLTAR
jgi:uncharacterized damage-inducible protein DinB